MAEPTHGERIVKVEGEVARLNSFERASLNVDGTFGKELDTARSRIDRIDPEVSTLKEAVGTLKEQVKTLQAEDAKLKWWIIGTIVGLVLTVVAGVVTGVTVLAIKALVVAK